MTPFVQFGGWAAFMAVVACILGAAARDHGLFGPNSSTIIAGVIQAAVTAGAIYATVWQTRRSFDRENARHRTEAVEDRMRAHREAAALVSLAASRINELAAVLTMGEFDRVEATEIAVDSLCLHVDALGRFPFERLSPTAAQAFEKAFQATVSARTTARATKARVDGWNEKSRSMADPRAIAGSIFYECAGCASDFRALADIMLRCEPAIADVSGTQAHVSPSTFRRSLPVSAMPSD